MPTRRADTVHIDWSVPGGAHGRLVCPDHPNLDITVERAREGDPLHKLMAPAKAVRDHLATHHQEPNDA